MTVADPTLVHERRLLRDGATMVIGVDEVGRGAIAGPVAIGVSVLMAPRRTMPAGLRDSKMLSEKRREQLQPLVAAWSAHWAVGLADNTEVDRLGIMVALGLAGARALASLRSGGLDLAGAVLLLDGSYDYLSAALPGAGIATGDAGVRVRTRIKADRDCATVAAASVLAKVHRDRMMIDAHERWPEYRWCDNKGYASAEHYAAVDRVGASELHRVTWLRQPSLLDGLEVESVDEAPVVGPAVDDFGSVPDAVVPDPLTRVAGERVGVLASAALD